MAKTKEELEQLKKKYESLVTKLDELNDNELNSVTGGVFMRPLGDRVAIKVTGEEE